MDKKNLKKNLSSASYVLLGAVPLAHAGEQWTVDTSVLQYSESDGRVQATEPVIDVNRKFSKGQEANVKFTVDVLTGASPNGATASNVPQTFTRPSGKGTYVVSPGEIPLDDTFHDTRFAVNGMWKQPLGRLSLMNFGANFSTEHDFRSLGLNTQWSHDFNERNTTLMLGAAIESDQVTPEGGAPVPFAIMQPTGSSQPKEGDKSKSVLDGLIGVTQVLNRRTLMQFNYSYSRNSGYMTDPYKLLSRVDGGGNTVDYVYERRPDSRTKHALYWLTRYALNRDVISFSYRYFTDDWGIRSHTVDTNYHWKYSEKQYLEPRLRYYTQTQADFFHVNLLSADALPDYASADYRLAKFHGFTYGLKWGWHLKNDRELMVRAEYYTQIGDSSPGSAVGVQKGLDLYPDLKATILQVQYKF